MKKKKLTREQKDIEAFIKWLKRFYKANDKEKNLILVKLHQEDIRVYNFVNDLRHISEYDQERLYSQLRMGLYND